MPKRSSLLQVVGVVAGFWGSCLLGCTSPGSQQIIGPDGSQMSHVHCGSDQGVCFRIAGELCPTGYEMKPVLSGSDGNFLVRCRAATATATLARCPTPAPVAKTKEGWPPATEPWPAANPWPRPDASTAAHDTAPAPTPPHSAESDNIDIGY